MYTRSLVAVAAIAGAAVAQTPAGWNLTAAVTNSLGLTWDNITVTTAGMTIPRADTASPPVVKVSDTIMPSTATGILMMIDMDVARNNTRVPLLHWMVTGVTNPSGTLVVPTPAATAGATFIQPSPPQGDFAHRYVVVLFAEPSGFTYPTAFADVAANRVDFNMSLFLSDAGIKTAPLAANYIRVQNTTALTTTTTTFPALVTAVANATKSSSTTKTTTTKSTTTSVVTASKAGAERLGMGSTAAGIMGLAAMLL